MRAAVLAALVVVVGALPAAAAEDETFVSLEARSSGIGYEIVVQDASGRNATHPVSKDVIRRPAVSPDGTRIAYSAPISDATAGRWAIFRSPIDGTGRKRLTTPDNADSDPAWSADGRWIAYSRDTKGSLRTDNCCVIRVMRANGEKQSKVPGTRGGINPSWSPNGNRIVYEKDGGLWVTNLSGGSAFQLAVNGHEPAWSPDGDRIAYVRAFNGSYQVVVIPASGGSPNVRAASNTPVESPVWDADGTTLYWVRYSGDGYDGRAAVSVWWDRAGDAPARLFGSSRRLVHLTHAGSRTAPCDFNGDLTGDLAVGAPHDDEAGQDSSGAVNVLRGSVGDGLTGSRDEFWHQGMAIGGTPGSNDHFGAALACGDFDGDGRSDLAIGAPEDFLGRGVVNVLYGTASGLSTAGNELLHQNVPGVSGTAEPGDAFGYSLASGDFDGDGLDDLAIGVPGNAGGGAVNVLYGSPGGLTGGQLWTQDSPGIKGESEAGDRFGAALTAGNFDGNKRDDLAIGVPGENGSRGAVAVIYGRSAGLDAAGDQLWRQGSGGLRGEAESGDVFGDALAAGDIDGDGRDDLAIGVPGENKNRGAVSVVYGTAGKLSGSGDDLWMQGKSGIRNAAERGDRFGDALAVGDFDHDGRDDLAVGVPGENDKRGAVAVVYGSPSGATAVGDDLWRQGHGGVKGSGQRNDRFGKTLFAGDFDGDRLADLVVGVPREDYQGIANAGAFAVLYGNSGGLTAAGDQLWRQGVDGLQGTRRQGDRLGTVR